MDINARLFHALLRRYEPILRFTKGERFFPMPIDPYLAASSLWVQEPDKAARRLASEGELTPERLAIPLSDVQGTVHYLKFIEPMNMRDLAVAHLRHEHGVGEDLGFHPGRGRLARVGYVSRLVDAFYSLVLLARGRVPGDTATAAIISYQKMLATNRRYCYHGRVYRRDGWTVLQYWFFYAFNNWRSGFSGANDHEADWEMISIYLAETPPVSHPGAEEQPDQWLTDELARYRPEWVAYASHDYAGDDLRRHWDDPEVRKEGTHPVVFVGAGSHASYFSPGEYLTEIELAFLDPVVHISQAVQEFLRRNFRQYTPHTPDGQGNGEQSLFTIPFVDYAHGDGKSIGPGQEIRWDDPVSLSPTPGWVRNYRGLWGLYTRDRFRGEDAPAGPMHNRDGTVRRAWYDPIGWAGLEKVPPSTLTASLLEAEQARLRSEQGELALQVESNAQELMRLGIHADSMRDQLHLAAVLRAQRKKIADLSAATDELRARIANNEALLQSLALHAERLRRGEIGPLRAHIRRAHAPATQEHLRTSQLAEFWAAASVGVSLVIFMIIVFFFRNQVWSSLLFLATVLGLVEAGFRGRLPHLVTRVTLALVVVATLVLIYEFLGWLVFAAVVLAGGYTLWVNLRAFWRG